MINDEDFTDEQLLLTTVQAARVLGIGRTSVYALMKEGLLHPVHVGRSCRISWGTRTLHRMLGIRRARDAATGATSCPSGVEPTGRQVRSAAHDGP